MPSVDPFVALHSSAIVTRLHHVHVVRFTGDDASVALSRLCAAGVRARDGQLQHVILLDENAHCFADAFLLCDDEAYDLIYEGPTPAEMMRHIDKHVSDLPDVVAIDRSASHALIGIDGPFAWELVARVSGADAVGLPYLTFFHVGSACCYRAGKTGEYGYGYILPLDEADAFEQRLLTEGEALDITRGSLDVLDVGALESFYHNIRREGTQEATPIELQLQWRVDYASEGVGMDKLRAHRSRGISRRVTTLVSNSRMALGDVVRLGEREVGQVVNAAWSHAREQWLALALIDIACAVPGIDDFVIGTHDAPVTARSVSPPVLNHSSLFVSPQMHGYHTRHEIALPPLVRA